MWWVVGWKGERERDGWECTSEMWGEGRSWESRSFFTHFTQSYQVTWQASFKPQANWSQFEFTLPKATDCFSSRRSLSPNYSFVLPHRGR